MCVCCCKRIIVVRSADLGDCVLFVHVFVVLKCVVVVSRPMKIVTFLQKKRDPAKRVVDFPRARDTFRNKIMELFEDFDEKSYNNNGKPWKSSGILRVNPFFSFFFLFSSCFSIFSFFLFFHFCYFFHFSISLFFIFSFFHFLYFFIFFVFPFFQFFIFLHFLSFSFIFYHFLPFSFSLLGAQNLIFG